MNMDIDEVTEKARNYLQSAGYYASKINKITAEGNKWIVLLDTGALINAVKKVTIEDNTGKVVGFE